MKQAIIKTENPEYNGQTYGVTFNLGTAIIHEGQPNRWGLTFDELVSLFKTLPGYKVVLPEQVELAPAPTGKKVKE